MKTLRENLLRNVGVGKIKLIENWLNDHNFDQGSYKINSDYTITPLNPVELLYDDYDELPSYIQFANADQSYRIYSKGVIKSFQGLPFEVRDLRIFVTSKQKKLPELSIKCQYFVTIAGRNLNNITNLYVEGSLNGSKFYMSTNAKWNNIKLKNIMGINIQECPIGTDVYNIVKDVPFSSPLYKKINALTQEQLNEIQGLLKGVDINNGLTQITLPNKCALLKYQQYGGWLKLKM